MLYRWFEDWGIAKVCAHLRVVGINLNCIQMRMYNLPFYRIVL